MGSESDIELVAVSCKFDFSERRNLPNKETDPDHKLPKGFWGPPSFSQFIFCFPSHPLLEIHKGLQPFSSSILPTPPPPPPVSLSPLIRSVLACLLSAHPQCLTTPPSVAICPRPQDPPPEKSLRSPGRPKLKVQCALSRAATPVG